ncbi:deaminase [Streptomyces sp. NPDC029674]|uniref:deaminase n=1 Tax=Streptomyces sp. NPDC029674 TaxID=3365297 RepID=UPI00384BE98B
MTESPEACGQPGPGTETTTADRAWLAVACQLATQSPPSATALSGGAVIVADDGTELARAHSRREGPHDHAEEAALGQLAPGDPRLAEATLYSSLEPCAERASRPRPCARLVREAGIRRVVVGWVPGVDGAERLEAAGITVIELPEYADAAKSPNRHLL